MSTPEIIPWPEKPMFDELPEMYNYERALAEAAISRLQVALEVLNAVATKRRCCIDGIVWKIQRTSEMQDMALEALASIGELKGEI